MEIKNLEVSIGLLTGYFIAGLLNMWIFEKTWSEAFADQKLLFGFVGIALSIILYRRNKSK